MEGWKNMDSTDPNDRASVRTGRGGEFLRGDRLDQATDPTSHTPHTYDPKLQTHYPKP